MQVVLMKHTDGSVCLDTGDMKQQPDCEYIDGFVRPDGCTIDTEYAVYKLTIEVIET